MASSKSQTSAALIAAANNVFTVQLYQRLMVKQGGQNLFFSPLSISTALAMTYAGARGETASQMSDVLRFSLVGDEELHHAFKSLNDCLYDPRAISTLKSANKLYGKAGYQFLREFLRKTTAFYNSAIEAVDFGSPDARIAINDWVSKQTEGKITNLIAPGALSAATRLVLVNAIYFKGPWDSPFKSYQTINANFAVLDGRGRVPVKLMNQSGHFGLAVDNTLECLVLELPYKGNAVSMMIVLPNKDDGLPNLEAKLSADTLRYWNDNLRRRLVTMWLPRFKLENDFSLARVLGEMGMSDAFDANGANFGGIADDQLYISEVIHKAFVDVNEEGSEAAAATAVVMMPQCGFPVQREEPVIFRADHPFLFMIRHRPTQAILFVGRVMDTS